MGCDVNARIYRMEDEIEGRIKDFVGVIIRAGNFK